MLLATVDVAVSGISGHNWSYHGYFHSSPRIVKHQMGNFTFRNLIHAGNLGATKSAGGFYSPICFIVFEDYIEGKAERTRLLASDRRTDVAQARHLALLIPKRRGPRLVLKASGLIEPLSSKSLSYQTNFRPN